MRKTGFKVIIFLLAVIVGQLALYQPALAAYYSVFNLDSSIPVNSKYGNFACTVTTSQTGNKIQATVSIVGDITDFNRLGWNLSEGSTNNEDTSETITTSTTFPKSHTFNTNLQGSTVYAARVTFYSDPAIRTAIDCFATFTTDPTPPDTGSQLLGRVIKSSPDTLSCNESRFYYGDSCGNSSCQGVPNYTITWSQGNISQSIGNNSCYAQAGQNQPRYTFDWRSPQGDRNGRLTSASIQFSDPNVFLTGWGGSTSDSAGNTYPGSNQGSYFSSPGPNQTIQVKVFRDGDFQWNHLWFYYQELNQASCQSISLSKTTIAPGGKLTANVSMKNEGSKAWTSGANYRLGSQDPQDYLWDDTSSNKFNRVALPFSVAPGQTVNFPFKLTAPQTPGIYNFDWQMVQDGVSWFGQTCKLKLTVLTPPTISSLQVSNSVSSQTVDSTGVRFTGDSKSSGLQGSEGGKNWQNPMNITLNATAYGTTATGTTNSIKQYFVAFYDKHQGTGSIQPAYSSIIANTTTSDPNANLKSLLINNPAAGFLLAYDPGSNPPTTGKHYVWDPTSSKANKWVDITGNTGGYQICGSAGCATQPYYIVFSGNPKSNPPNPRLPHSWTIALDKNFGSKSMYTAGYVTDNNNLTTYQANINP